MLLYVYLRNKSSTVCFTVLSTVEVTSPTYLIYQLQVWEANHMYRIHYLPPRLCTPLGAVPKSGYFRLKHLLLVT